MRILNDGHWSTIKCCCSKCPPALFTHALQPLPLAPEEVCSRSFAMWFKVLQPLMAFSLACGRFLAWYPTCDSQQNSLHTMFLLLQRLNSFEVCLPVKLYRLYMLLMPKKLHLKFVKHKLTTWAQIPCVYKFHLTMTSFFSSWFHVFTAYPQGCAAGSTFSQHIHRDANFDVKIC